jgi:hypothetical protein
LQRAYVKRHDSHKPEPTRAVNGYGFHRLARSCHVGHVPLDSVVSLVAAAVRDDSAWYIPTRRVSGRATVSPSCRGIQFLEAAWFMAPRAASACVSQKKLRGLSFGAGGDK